MTGPGDGNGFVLSKISLQQVYYPSVENIINQTFSNTFIKTINALPGSRVVLGTLMSYFSNLDRYQFYIYHYRNYSYYS